MRLESARGTVLVETLMALAVLAVITGFVLESLLASLSGSRKVRQAFAASQALENFLFDAKSDEHGDRFARPHTGGPVRFPDGREYAYSVDSRIIGDTRKAWGTETVYQQLDIQLRWNHGKEKLSAQTVVRTHPRA
ncbi:MAG: type II secretion system protein [Candidatus Omnitrophica bacterium]|nr:type II secretion system protein [Candidatus Omnitrophota bacterium]